MADKLHIALVISTLALLVACNSRTVEKIPESTPMSTEVYERQLKELKEPEGMLEKEKFFAKKAFLEEQSGRLEAAIESLENAIKLNPGQGLYHFRLAQLYRKKNDWHNARQSAEQAIRLGTNSEDLLLFLADLYLQEKNYEDGLEFLDDRFYGLPESAELLLIKGQLLLGLNDSTAALQALEKSYSLGSTRSTLILANYYLNSDPQKSIDLINSLKFKNDDANWTLARAYIELDEILIADSLIKLLSQPTVEQRLIIPRFHRDNGNQTKAILSYRELVSEDSTNQTAKVELAELERKVAYLQSQRRAARNDSSQQITKPDSVTNNE